MKLSRTLKVKIGKLSKRKQNSLDGMLSKNAKAINFCLQEAKKGKRITHNLVYKDLRRLNLPATVIHGCRAKSVEIYKSYRKRKGRKSFPVIKNSRVRYDNVVVKLRKTDNIRYKYFISLLYKATQRGKSNNRIELPLIVNSEYQTDIIQQIGEDYKLGSTELVKRGSDYYVHISYNKEVNLPVPDESFSPIGVDLGINNLTVSVAQSSVLFHSGKRLTWKGEFFRKERDILQQNAAFQELYRLKDRQTKYNNHYLLNNARDIVEQAKRETNPVIILEDLTHIRDTSRVRKKQRYKHHTWIFRRQQQAIEHMALWDGIPVMYVDPYHSSQICSQCGELNKRNKHTYKCKACGFECNSDYNAGRNLQQFFRAICSEERASINNASRQIISEPMVKMDNLVGNDSIPPMPEGMGILEVIL